MKQEILDLIEYKNLDLADYYSEHDLSEDLDYDGSLHELIDGMIDIYNYDLRKWAVNNWQYIDDAKDEGLIDEETDYHAQIQAGQYLYYRNEAYEAISEIYAEFEPEEPESDEEEVA